MGETGPVVRWSETKTDMELAFAVQVTAASASALKTALEALRAAAVANSNADLVLERVSGTTLFQWLVSDGSWSRIEGNVEFDVGALDDASSTHVALAVLTFRAERVGLASGSAGDPADAIAPLDWGVAFDANGRGSASVAATFETLATAQAWVATLRSGAGKPAWLGTAWRFASVTYNPSQQLNQGSPVPTAAYTPCAVTVVFRAMVSAFAADSAFADVVDCTYNVNAVPRQGTPDGAGFDLTITGSLQFKTENDATFDSGDTTSVAANTLRTKALACIESIKTDAQTRSGYGFTQLDDVDLTYDAATGEVIFSVKGVSLLPNNVLAWAETVTIQRTPLDVIMPGTKARRVYQDALGADWTIRHSLAISALSVPSYRAPALSLSAGDWLERPATKHEQPPMVSANGTRVYATSWEKEWMYVGSGEPSGVSVE
jgi:hypothetical protein